MYLCRENKVAEKTGIHIRVEGSRLLVGGPVIYDTVVEATRAGEAAIKTGDMLVDLAEVVQVDSSAVSMLLEWVRKAQTYGRRIRFINLPENLANLIELYDVSDLIPVGNPDGLL